MAPESTLSASTGPVGKGGVHRQLAGAAVASEKAIG